jgi:hypothetical protein
MCGAFLVFVSSANPEATASSGCVTEVHVHFGHVPSTALPGIGCLLVMKFSDLPVKF